MILKTERLSLRPLEAGDAMAVHQMMSDPEVMIFWDSAPIENPAQTAELVARQVAEADAGFARFWVVEQDGEAAFVGVCDLSEIDRRHARAEVGFMLHRAQWGKGYALEAMHAVVGFAAQSLRLRRLQARTHLGNVRSLRLLGRLGFEREGLMRGYVERDGQRRDCFMLGLLL